MRWERLTASDVARCECGASHGHPEAGTVTWWIKRPAGYLAPIPCHAYRCRNKRCKLVYWGHEVAADGPLADQPPDLLPFARTG